VNELVQLVQQRTGLSQDVAQTVVNTVMEHLKSRLPAGMSAGLDQLMGGTASADASSKGSMLETAETMISGMMGSKEA
jgi:nucleoid DNA-binding protein